MTEGVAREEGGGGGKKRAGWKLSGITILADAVDLVDAVVYFPRRCAKSIRVSFPTAR